ncbi:sensor histidine kinase [Sphingobium sp. TKS]|uniref:sensor histidine kinase n=1 Tax=Sphingobium sp. TKS TaxID=1315974 RepID=UPI0007704427|nr:histidine kinase dimerization/phosphoacceptor domain -containing protein [Sphingobium sp. TKS]AMK23182.1 signal transduction histidine kinase [Sphingobium sp. TKS]
MNRTTHPDVGHNLALAILASTAAPALLLDGDLGVIAGSASFYRTFSLDPKNVAGKPLFKLGAGEWDVPQLRSLLNATLSGIARIEAYEMDLKGDAAPRRLVLNAQNLDYGDAEQIRLLLTISDVTEARISEKLKDDLLREKAILLQELQHRVANSLQIIASVLMQSARRVQSEETRSHLHDAHHRVMSIATVQQQLAASRLGEVELHGYFTQLCQSLGASMIRNHDQVSIAVTADGSSVSADISVSLGLIVTELVINALKRAFPGDHSGKILVDYHSHEAEWKLSVSDDGVGTPETMASAKPGLGTSIVEALANQLDATVQTEAGYPGTTISIAHTASGIPAREPL